MVSTVLMILMVSLIVMVIGQFHKIYFGFLEFLTVFIGNIFVFSFKTDLIGSSIVYNLDESNRNICQF